MLVNSDSRFSKGDILAIKTTLGEEIICEYDEESASHYVVKQPFTMAITQQGAHFAPLVMFGNPEIKTMPIQKVHCMFVVLANDEITAGYKSQVSGIITPKEPKIVT